MALFRFFKKRDEAEAAPHGAPAAAAKPFQSPPPAAAPQPSAAPSPDEPVHESDNVIAMLQDIQSLIGGEDETIQIPCESLLSRLPPELRGSSWKPGPYPDAVIELETAPLLEKLKEGRIVYPLSEIIHAIPDGWVQDLEDAMVELDLAEVVQRVPHDKLGGAELIADDVREVAGMRDYFHREGIQEPVAAPEAVPPRPEPAATQALATSAPAPAGSAPILIAPPYPTDKVYPGMWDGVEIGLDAGTNGVDLNTCALEDLVNLPGVGLYRAKLILQARERLGRFSSIYDVLRVRGVGRRLFIEMTGLQPAPSKRRDRHETLNGILGLAPDARPSLAALMKETDRVLEADGCVLASRDGIPLAVAGDRRNTDRVAAVMPQIFRRLGRYMRQLTKAKVKILFLPHTDPAELLIGAEQFLMTAFIRKDADLNSSLGAAKVIGEELNWLLGPRAVVRKLD
jgi:competence ComEA-like helix-hairpin-helix protein